VDRANLQKEVDSLTEEIDRIADSANFNGINLLDGTQAAGTTRVENWGSDTASKAQIILNLSFTDAKQLDGATITIGSKVMTFDLSGTTTQTAVSTTGVTKLKGDETVANLKTMILNAASTVRVTQANGSGVYTLTGAVTGGELVYTAASADKGKGMDALSLPTVSAKRGLELQIGDTSDSYNQIRTSISDIHVKSLYIDKIDISTQDGAATAIDKIKNAINMVSSTRGDLGAIQNRLEHTQNNLSVMAENIQDAESTIRDTDVADEMMAYTKNNILVQSAQAMLAQANTVPQGVLQLLQ
jgi:flagellin